MTYTFKLSRRLALAQISTMLAPIVLLVACSSSDLTDTSTNIPDDEAPLSELVVSPKHASLSPATVDATVDSALGGSTASGKGKGRGRGKRDDSSSLDRVSISPDPVGLYTTQSQRFSARGVLTDGSVVETSVRWEATGGTIDSTGWYQAGRTPGRYRVMARSVATEHVDSAVVVISDSTATVTAISLTPSSASLTTGGTQQLSATARLSDGSERPADVTYQATGGTITNQGMYTAGQTPGSYRVIATVSGGTLADTTAMLVTAPAPTVAAVVLTPATVTLAAGATQRFAATARLSDGSTAPVAVTFRATGGSITADGLYTAGPTGGSFQAIATQTGGTLADTAAITVTVEAPSPPPATGGVPVQPGQSIQAVVDANPAGTTILLKAGVHRRQSVRPKHGSTFVCESGTVLDGELVSQHAFWHSGGDPDNVTIRGCRITRYNVPAQLGAILAGGHDISSAGTTTGWVVEDNEIDNNVNGGIRIGTQMVVRRNKVHHNTRIGIVGFGNDVLIEGNEIAYNNPTCTGLGHESGGTKFVLTNRLIVRGNHAHHNCGPSLWVDSGNDATLFEGNVVEDNTGAGIASETSYSAVIRNNIVRRNGPAGWGFGAQIEIAGSGGSGIEIYGNTVLATTGNGIMLIQQNRGSGRLGPYVVQNVWVHDNTLDLHQSGTQFVAGAVDDTGVNAIYSSRNNRFTNNRYNLSGAGAVPFAWMNGYKSEAQWRGYGHDLTGTFSR